MFRIAITALALLQAMTCLLSVSASAQEDLWTPPEPSAKEKDWVRISSGEWLWGTINLMRDESLEFDSEEFDVVTVDWVDIAEIRSARHMTYVLLDGTMVTGTSAFKDDLLKISISTRNHTDVFGIPLCYLICNFFRRQSIDNGGFDVVPRYGEFDHSLEFTVFIVVAFWAQNRVWECLKFIKFHGPPPSMLLKNPGLIRFPN